MFWQYPSSLIENSVLPFLKHCSAELYSSSTAVCFGLAVHQQADKDYGKPPTLVYNSDSSEVMEI